MKEYSPYIKDRAVMDDGFSKGWGSHFRPSEEYVIDCHAHSGFEGNAAAYKALVDSWFNMTEAYRQQKIILFVDKPSQTEIMPELMKLTDRVQWMYFAKSGMPCPSLLRRTKELGACGIKLHNYDIMKGIDPIIIWDDPKWQEVFEWADAERFPIIWHVTQRVSYSPYHGGGFNSYFSEGEKRGRSATNAELLEQLKGIMRKFPNIPIIGAHQMYMAPDRLAELFDEFENLHIDTSVGYYLRWCDELEERDRIPYHDFFVKYHDRILFGTDTDLVPEGICDYQKETFKNHLRFIHKLDLPYDVLQDVMYRNSERLMHIPQSESARKHNTRP